MYYCLYLTVCLQFVGPMSCRMKSSIIISGLIYFWGENYMGAGNSKQTWYCLIILLWCPAYKLIYIYCVATLDVFRIVRYSVYCIGQFRGWDERQKLSDLLWWVNVKMAYLIRGTWLHYSVTLWCTIGTDKIPYMWDLMEYCKWSCFPSVLSFLPFPWVSQAPRVFLSQKWRHSSGPSNINLPVTVVVTNFLSVWQMTICFDLTLVI